VRRPLGQHFLFDRNILRKIVDSSNITTEDTVVEIGAGLGTLTRVLSERAKKVIAIEVDKKLIVKLREALSQRENVEIINANALKFPYDTIKERFKVVSNIPYNITTPLIFRLLEFRKMIITMSLLLQKEVALRIVASPNSKDYGILSISIQLYTRPKIVFFVSRKAFSPSPDVDSALVHFKVSSAPLFKIKDEELFMMIVRRAFSQRRKTILNSLKGFENVKVALHKANINPLSRPETLSIKDFIRLTKEIKP